METIQEVAQTVTSKPVQRAVVNTFLLVSSALALFLTAAVASALFFYNFVPDQVVTRPIHLQYGSGINPYGLVPLSSPALKTQQEYDISVSLSMPRSPVNMERGNFMVSIALLDAPVDTRLTQAARSFADTHQDFGDSHRVLFESRRPTLLPFVDPVVSMARRILFLLYYMLLPASHSVDMTVQLAERVWFPKASTTTVPAAAYIEVEAGQTLQVYKAVLTMTAQLKGLRWLMFHYRLPTYIAFTFMFWICEVVFMSLAWLFWSTMSSASSSSSQSKQKVLIANKDAQYEGESEQETGDLEDEGASSDRPYHFPTYGRQPALRHEPSVKVEVKAESGEEGGGAGLARIPAAGTEADDEEDSEEDGARWDKDSGLGTSSYSHEGSERVKKRSSRTFRE